MYIEKMDVHRENGCTSRKWMYICKTKEMYMYTVRIVSTVIMALVLMGCPPPVSNNSTAPPSVIDDPAPVRKHHVAYVSAGKFHTVIVKTDDTLWAVGRNSYGQLGNGDKKRATKLTPVQVKTAAGEPMTEVDSVSAGWAYTTIVKKDGTLWGVGLNDEGQLGDGTEAYRSTPVQAKTTTGEPMTEVEQVSARSNHTMIIKTDESLWAVGRNRFGQLGVLRRGGSNVWEVNPVPVLTAADGEPMTGVAQVSAGGNHTVILMENGELYAVGLNGSGQLGDHGTGELGDRISFGGRWPVRVMGPAADGGDPQPMINVKQISAGFSHTMILKNDDTLWATGLNNKGQLGDHTNVSTSIPVKVMTEVAQVSVGNDHTLILKINGELWAVGRNNKGQLGDGSIVDTKTPVQVMEISVGGGKPQPMTNVKQISAGDAHTMIVKNDGTLWGTGSNEHGQLGDGSTTDKLNPEQITPIAGCHNHFTEEKK